MSEEPRAPGFQRRWTALGLGDAAGGLTPRQTLTPRTFRLSRPHEPDSTATTQPAPPPSNMPGPVMVGPLPTIKLAYPPGVADSLRPPPSDRPLDLSVRGLIAEGGMGRVFVARQHSLDREVAVKMPRSGVPDATTAASLVGEARIAGSLEHPMIVPVHALGLDPEGRPVIVMKRVQGVTWATLLAEPEHPAWARRLERSGGDRLSAHLEVLMNVCDALDFAHAAGVVHRDIKPENVLVGDYGETYLSDWGVAVRSSEPWEAHEGVVVGTPAYLAPEMVDTTLGPPDARTDVYLLGATLHEVLTGRPRHEAASLYQALALAWDSRPVDYPREVPTELALLCNRATSRDRALRPASAGAFRQALVEHLRHRGVLALTRAAKERLGELEAALSRTTEQGDASVDRLATECRFAFHQALREWPEHAGAREGLQRCLELLAERELTRGGPGAARALLAELPAPRPDLLARAHELEARLSTERDQAARYATLTRERDLGVGSRGRLRAALVLYAFAFAFSAWALLRPARTTTQDLSLFGVTALAVIALGTSLAWRRLPSTTVNRQILLVAPVAALAFALHRGVALALGSRTSQVFASDLTLFGLTCALAAVFLDRRLALGTLFSWGALAPLGLWPDRGDAVFAVGVSLALGACVLVWSRPPSERTERPTANPPRE